MSHTRTALRVAANRSPKDRETDACQGESADRDAEQGHAPSVGQWLLRSRVGDYLVGIVHVATVVRAAVVVLVVGRAAIACGSSRCSTGCRRVGLCACLFELICRHTLELRGWT